MGLQNRRIEHSLPRSERCAKNPRERTSSGWTPRAFRSRTDPSRSDGRARRARSPDRKINPLDNPPGGPHAAHLCFTCSEASDSGALRVLSGGPRLPDHLHQHAPGLVAALYFSQEGRTPAMNTVTSLQPEVESEAIHCSHRGLVGDRARRAACWAARDDILDHSRANGNLDGWTALPTGVCRNEKLRIRLQRHRNVGVLDRRQRHRPERQVERGSENP